MGVLGWLALVGVGFAFNFIPEWEATPLWIRAMATAGLWLPALVLSTYRLGHSQGVLDQWNRHGAEHVKALDDIERLKQQVEVWFKDSNN